MAGEASPKPKLLIGQDEAIVDDKGRVLFSKKKRDRLGEDFVMCLGDRGCVEAYPLDVWEPLVERVMDHDPSNVGRQDYARHVLGTASDENNFDAQGRAVIPRALREAAGLTGEVLLVGAGDRLEIWSEKAWKELLADPKGYGADRHALVNGARIEMKDERWGAYDRLPR